MNIDKNSVAMFRIDFAKAVEGLEKQYGVKMSIGTIRMGTSEFYGKLNVANVNNENGLVMGDKVKFAMYTNQLGLMHTYGQKFTERGVEYTVIGYNQRRPKFPFDIVDEAGTVMKATEGLIAKHLGRKWEEV